ncbi:kelch-like protein 12 [Paramacrobiotus metropolitanus]|uniref:kelch-like protein 12 n=1 Tax=Paramacrobiotus metropolitanus TaxID=2943436 RepID=UPI002445DA10|nr:kelch-like protein 12 [Paramacrobiotus metropolitanus]
MSAVWHLKRSKLPQAVLGCGLAVAENSRLIVIGGIVDNSSHGTKRVCQVDLQRNACTDLAPMQVGRFYGGVAALNGRVYAAGGFSDASTILDAMECYEPEKDVWQSVAALPLPLAAFVMVVFKDRLYVFGGCLQMRAEPVNSTFCYDPEANAWSKLADMPTARKYCSACVGLNGLVYGIGGLKGLRCVQAYDPISDRWLKKSNTINQHFGAGCACVDGKVYVVGGCIRATGSDIEVYDEDADTWRLLPCRLPANQTSFGCAVLTVKKGQSLAGQLILSSD